MLTPFFHAMMLHRRQFLASIPMISFAYKRSIVAIVDDGIENYEIVVENGSEESMIRAIVALIPKALNITLRDINKPDAEYISVNVLNVRFWFRSDNQKFITYQTISF